MIRQVNRKGGYAWKAANIIENILSCINAAAGLEGPSALTLESCLRHFEEGQRVQKQMEAATLSSTIFKNVVKLWGVLGPEAKRAVLGHLASDVPPATAEKLFGVSRTALNKAKSEMQGNILRGNRSMVSLAEKAGASSTFGQSRLSAEEMEATKKWFHAKNPSRSGDTQLIAWMMMEKIEFYFLKEHLAELLFLCLAELL